MTEIVLLSTLGAIASYPLLKWSVSKESSLEVIEKSATKYVLPVLMAFTGILFFTLYSPTYVILMIITGLLAGRAGAYLSDSIQNKRYGDSSILTTKVPVEQVNYNTNRRKAWINGFLLYVVAAILVTEAALSDKEFVAVFPRTAVFVSGDRIVPELLNSLGSTSWKTRHEALASLISLGKRDLIVAKGEAAVPALIFELDYNISSTRQNIKDMLVEIGSPAVPLLNRALGDTGRYSRPDIAMILGKIGDKKAVPALLISLTDSNDQVRSWSADALSRIKDPSIVNHLVELLGRPPILIGSRDIPSVKVTGQNTDLRWLILGILGEIGDPSTLKAITPWLKSADLDLSIRAAKAIGMIGHPMAIPSLIEVIKSEDLPLHVEAAEALGKIGGGEAVAALTQALSTKDQNMQMRIIQALGETRGESTVPLLTDIMKDPQGGIEWVVALALGKLGDVSQVTQLLAALAHDNTLIKQAAIKALGELKEVRAVPALIEMQKPATSATLIRKLSIEALGKIGDRNAVHYLIDALNLPDPEIRAEAVIALGKIRDTRAIKPLLDALTYPSRAVAGKAALALANMKVTPAIPEIKAVHGESPYNRSCEFCRALDSLNESAYPPAFSNGR